MPRHSRPDRRDRQRRAQHRQGRGLGGAAATSTSACWPREDAVGGDWVLIHVGFAMAKIDEQEAADTREFLEQLGAPFEEGARRSAAQSMTHGRAHRHRRPARRPRLRAERAARVHQNGVGSRRPRLPRDGRSSFARRNADPVRHRPGGGPTRRRRRVHAPGDRRQARLPAIAQQRSQRRLDAPASPGPDDIALAICHGPIDTDAVEFLVEAAPGMLDDLDGRRGPGRPTIARGHRLRLHRPQRRHRDHPGGPGDHLPRALGAGPRLLRAPRPARRRLHHLRRRRGPGHRGQRRGRHRHDREGRRPGADRNRPRRGRGLGDELLCHAGVALEKVPAPTERRRHTATEEATDFCTPSSIARKPTSTPSSPIRAPRPSRRPPT